MELKRRIYILYFGQLRSSLTGTCDLSKDLLEKYDIAILPLHILLGETEYRDGVDITPEEIFRWSDENKTTPKTSAPSLYQTMGSDDHSGWEAVNHLFLCFPSWHVHLRQCHASGCGRTGSF